MTNKIHLVIEQAELATILAALRTYQAAGYGDPANRPEDIHAIATDDDVISLDDAAIDTLCEEINCSSNISPVLVVISAGVGEIAKNPSDLPVRILDLDNLAADVETAIGGDNPGDFDCLIPEELAFIKEHQPSLWKRLQPFLDRPDEPCECGRPRHECATFDDPEADHGDR